MFVQYANAGQPTTFSTADGAIRGYDPVAYFVMGEATPGKSKYSSKWQGAIYRFSSADNLALFKADPERYAPRYGGYCAYAAAKGRNRGNRSGSLEHRQRQVVSELQPGGKETLEQGYSREHQGCQQKLARHYQLASDTWQAGNRGDRSKAAAASGLNSCKIAVHAF